MRAQERFTLRLWEIIRATMLLALIAFVPVLAGADSVGRTFKDCDECPKLVVVPAGEYWMGSPVGEGGSDEYPRHRVVISKPLAVGVYEVTFGEWDACRSGGGCAHNPDDEGWGRGSRPVINVSWSDAREYVRWLKRKTGKGYRLLSESEWEYVARGGTETERHWGDDPADACDYANVADGDLKENPPEWWKDDWKFHPVPRRIWISHLAGGEVRGERFWGVRRDGERMGVGEGLLA